MNTLGAMIRAYRLGFHWSDKYERWVRIGYQGPPFKIEAHEVGLVPTSHSKDKSTHCEWWDGDPVMLDLIEGLANKKHETFYVDESGRRVT